MATRKRGRPPTRPEIGPSTAEVVAPVSPPMPAAQPAMPSLIERVCAHFGISSHQIKRYDGGGGTLEVVTYSGRRLTVELADLR